MLTKCCSESWFCLWGMNKFTARLNNTARWEERKEKTESREGEGKLEINKKEETEMRENGKATTANRRKKESMVNEK